MVKLNINKKFRKYKTIKNSKCNLKRTKIQKGGATAQEKYNFDTMKQMATLINQYRDKIFPEKNFSKESPYDYPLMYYSKLVDYTLDSEIYIVNAFVKIVKTFTEMINILHNTKKILDSEHFKLQKFYNMYFYYENIVDKNMNNIKALK